MSFSGLMLIAAGGAIGSVGRALLAWALPAGRLPWATILANVVGSFVIGWLMSRPGIASGESRAQAFAVVGLCGGFTTFSSFSWQTVEQMQRGAWSAAAANVIFSVTLCLAATWAGWRVGQ